MKHFSIALQFLTILPVKIKAGIKDEDFGRSLLYFPAVGLLIGVILSITSHIFSFMPLAAQGAIVLLISVLITGAIHLDGFADTCDGLSVSHSKKKALAIMRDSRAGAMAAIGIVMILLIKLSFIMSVPPYHMGRSLIMMSVFSRWSQVFACYVSDYARKDGKAKNFISYAGKKEVIPGAIFVFILFLALSGPSGILIFALSCILTGLFIRYIKKRLGGMTGDTIGATNEVAEVIVLLFIIIFSGTL